MRDVEFASNAFVDFIDWVGEDPKIATRILTLISEIQGTPYQGLGKPEPLK